MKPFLNINLTKKNYLFPCLSLLIYLLICLFIKSFTFSLNYLTLPLFLSVYCLVADFSYVDLKVFRLAPIYLLFMKCNKTTSQAIQGCYRIFMNDFPDFSIKYSVFPLTSALTTMYIFPDLAWKHRLPPWLFRLTYI